MFFPSFKLITLYMEKRFKNIRRNTKKLEKNIKLYGISFSVHPDRNTVFVHFIYFYIF